MEKSAILSSQRRSAFTLTELVIVVGVISLLSCAAMLFFSPLEDVGGIQAGIDLREVWQMQRLTVAHSMASPGTAADPKSFTVSSLLPNVTLPSIAHSGSINAGVTPPTHSEDGKHGDSPKTSPQTGDGLYDVGPEY